MQAVRLEMVIQSPPPKTKAPQNCTAGALALALGGPAGSIPRAVAAAGALKETITTDYDYS